MTKGKVDFAVRRALNLFDKWNDVTGFVEKHTSYYYEMQGCITDAVHCGIQEACDDYRELESEKVET